MVNKPLLIGVNTLIFYIHLIGEKNYYKMLSREYDIDITVLNTMVLFIIKITFFIYI